MSSITSVSYLNAKGVSGGSGDSQTGNGDFSSLLSVEMSSMTATQIAAMTKTDIQSLTADERRFLDEVSKRKQRDLN